MNNCTRATPADARESDVLRYANHVRSFARWSLATLPEFCNAGAGFACSSSAFHLEGVEGVLGGSPSLVYTVGSGDVLPGTSRRSITVDDVASGTCPVVVEVMRACWGRGDG